MSKADSFMSDLQDSNFGVRPAGHTPAQFNVVENESPRYTAAKRDINAKLIRIDSIIAKEQVRKNFDETELAELAHSLKTLGQKSPILVYWSETDERYVIIAGERRYRAALKAGLTELACQVHPHQPDEAELVELQYVENAQRSDLNAIEEALSYKRLMELKGYSGNQLAQRIGKGQATVSRAMSLLKLPEDIQQHLIAKRIPVSVGHEMAKVADEARQREMAEAYLAGELTTGQAQEQTRKKAAGGRGADAGKQTKKWTQDGIAITVAYGRGVTLNDIAAVLEERAKLLRSDGRGKKAA